MILREKFAKLIYPNHIHINEISDWTDEFAIEFAEWINDNCWNIDADRFLYEEEQFKIKELLEIYKKEKQL